MKEKAEREKGLTLTPSQRNHPLIEPLDRNLTKICAFYSGLKQYTSLVNYLRLTARGIFCKSHGKCSAPSFILVRNTHCPPLPPSAPSTPWTRSTRILRLKFRNSSPLKIPREPVSSFVSRVPTIIVRVPTGTFRFRGPTVVFDTDCNRARQRALRSWPGMGIIPICRGPNLNSGICVAPRASAAMCFSEGCAAGAADDCARGARGTQPGLKFTDNVKTSEAFRRRQQSGMRQVMEAWTVASATGVAFAAAAI